MDALQTDFLQSLRWHFSKRYLFESRKKTMADFDEFSGNFLAGRLPCHPKNARPDQTKEREMCREIYASYLAQFYPPVAPVAAI